MALEHYIRIGRHDENLGVYRVTPRLISQVDVIASRHNIGSLFKAQPGDEDAWAEMRRQCPSWLPPISEGTFHRLDLAPGRFHRRIDRPIYVRSGTEAFQGQGPTPGMLADREAIASGLAQLSVLNRTLERLCLVIEPRGRNLAAYGHETRNLLVLAAMEVEAHCRAVLRANAYGCAKPTMRDYVKLLPVLKLDSWQAEFPQYPWLETFVPFAGWNDKKPTQSLVWYDAYNATKHDRETAMSRATLQHVFQAVAACAILMAAQFGRVGQLKVGDGGAPSVWTTAVPGPNEVYVPAFRADGRWRPQGYPFPKDPAPDPSLNRGRPDGGRGS